MRDKVGVDRRRMNVGRKVRMGERRRRRVGWI